VALSQRATRVLDALAELSESLRITLVLASVEALPYRVIAEILEIPEGTVAWRVNEARKQLRAKLLESERGAAKEVG
jgi:RNA polymerase sigma-70 factor (ECF subfamily)